MTMRNPELVRLLDEEIPRLRETRKQVRVGSDAWFRITAALTDATDLAAYLMEEKE